MSITTTSLLSLIKPDGSEHLTDWPWQNLINSMILDNKVKVQSFTYSPSLTGGTSDPDLGAGGQLVGKYLRLANRLIVVYGRFSFGSGIDAGSGSYIFSLPKTADSLHNSVDGKAFDMIGRWAYKSVFLNNTFVGAVELHPDNDKVEFNYGYGSGDKVGSVDPVAPSAGNTALTFYAVYQEAL